MKLGVPNLMITAKLFSLGGTGSCQSFKAEKEYVVSIEKFMKRGSCQHAV